MLTILVALLAAAISVEVAPDQPFRQVYVDEPLVVEFVSDTASTLDGTLTVEDASGGRETVPLPNVQLVAGQPHWQAFPRLARDRGVYTARIAANGTAQALSFSRVDRPAPDITPPALVRLNHMDDNVRLALKGLSLQDVRVDADQPDLLEALDEQPPGALRLVVSISGLEDDLNGLAELAASLNPLVARWEMPAPAGMESLGRASEILQQAGNGAPLALIVHTPESAAQLLGAGAGRFASALVLPPVDGVVPDPAAYRAAAETQGYEDFPLFPRVSGLDLHAAVLQQTLVRLLASSSVHRIELDAEHLMAGPRQPAVDYPRLVPLFVRLSDVRPAGVAPLGEEVEAYFFRHADQWILVAWETGDADELHIPVAPETQVSAFNGFNNPLETHRPEPETLAVPLTQSPVFVVGTGGPLPALVAEHMARAEAAYFLETATTAAALAPKAAASVEAIAQGAARPAPRLDFFNILQALPELERYWHAGTLPRSEAVPALASLARLAWHLTVLESARGEAFLEPLPESLAKCSEYQSSYLTGTDQRVRVPSRGDWLLQEVTRLADEAKALQDSGQSIEAGAVAALAEWRARSLVEAVKARPLHEPETAESPQSTAEEGSTS
jgi:hypothetical protein